MKRAVTLQNQQNDCAPSEDSNQPGHQPSLIRVFVVRMKKPWVLRYPLSSRKTLIRLGGCPSWSESSLGADTFCWFCSVVAQNIPLECLRIHFQYNMTVHVNNFMLLLFISRYIMNTYIGANVYWAKQETLHAFLQYLSTKTIFLNIATCCYHLAGIRESHAPCYFSAAIIYRSEKHHKRWKTRSEHAQALVWRFLHCRTCTITINQKLYESCGINATEITGLTFSVL